MKTIYIGRSQENNLVINDTSVSGRHGELSIHDNGQMVYTDYSTNGTYINGQLIRHASQPVTVNDLIVFPGDAQLDWNMIFGGVNPQPAYGGGAGTMVGGGFDPAAMGAVNHGGESCPPPAPARQGYRAKVSFSQAMSEGWQQGLKNAPMLFLLMLLSAVTCWIPYLNCGIFVAILTLPLQYAAGEKLRPTSIFESRFRRPIGQVLLSLVLICAAAYPAILFGATPVLLIAWMFVPMLIFARDMSVFEAMQASHKMTYGSKWTIFGLQIVVYLITILIMGLLIGLSALLLGAVGMGENGSIGGVIVLGILCGLICYAAFILLQSFSLGVNGSIWNQLKDKTEY